MGDPADCFKILVATDIHLGYNEKDPVRGNDSFITFEEILHNAKVNEVDFILLGGNLFHDTNPSQSALQKCIKLLRKYTLGDKPIEFEFLSDQTVDFHESGVTMVNYEDPNMNIAYPVFTIHGDRDDLCGFDGLSSLDLLATTGLVNHFGRSKDLTEIAIKPILMKKGETQLALYGLSYIHNDRLKRLLDERKVTMHSPDESTGNWFNLLMMHQNRADRGPRNYVPEEVVPEFLDLVVWGHERKCRIQLEQIPGKNFYVSQPGSSVATSLSEEESCDKHIGLLHVCRDREGANEIEFQMNPIPLKTVRPFIFKEINLDEYIDELQLDEGEPIPKAREFLKNIIDEMIGDAARKTYPDCPQQQKLPLIHLRVNYTDDDYIFNTIRFGQQYVEKVANPTDMIKFTVIRKRVKRACEPIDEEAMNRTFQDKKDDDVPLEDYIKRYFDESSNTQRLKVLSAAVMSEMCRQLVKNEEKDEDEDEKTKKKKKKENAMPMLLCEKILNFAKEKACEYFNEKMPEEEEFEAVLEDFRAKHDDIYQELLTMLAKCNTATAKAGTAANGMNDDEDEDDNAEAENGFAQPSTSGINTRPIASTSAASNRGRGRGRGAKRPTVSERAADTASERGRGRGAKAAAVPKVTRTTRQSRNK